MGTKFFKPGMTPIRPSNLNMEARALNAPVYAARADAAGANKDIGAAAGLSHAKVSPLSFMPGGKK